MKILGMRWGYDGGGFACGPVEGCTVVELIVADPDGHMQFVVASRMDQYEHIYVSPVSLYDLMICSNCDAVDFDATCEIIEKLATEDYDHNACEDFEPAEAFQKSKFQAAINFARFAMKACYGPDDPTYEGAQKFIADYLDQEVEDLPIPPVVYDEEDA